VPPISTLSDHGICNGELQVLNSTTFLGEMINDGSNSRYGGVVEMWCVQYKSQLSYRYFGLPELRSSLAARNVSQFQLVLPGETAERRPNISSPVLKLQSLVVRGGKANNSQVEWVFRRQHSLQADSVSAGSENEGDIAREDNGPVWQDALLACPFFSSSTFGRAKLLPVARSQSWAYGSTAMIQKVRIWTPENNLEGSTPLNSSNLVGVFLVQKGSLIGGSGHAQIVSALTSWHEKSLSCDARVEDLLHRECQGVGSIGENATLRTIIRHAPLGWAAADVTELAQCQLRQLELASASGSLPASFELGFLWRPVEPAEDIRFYHKHFPHRAAGDPVGDADRVFNASDGRTEWHSSESNDPPMIVFYWK